jgi:hypothetical protein
MATAPTPTPSPAPVIDLFTRGLSNAELWHLLWPVAAGCCLLVLGAAVVVGYIRRLVMSDWAPHWSRGAFGAALITGSVPAFLIFADRASSDAAARGVPVATLLLGVATQIGLFDEGGGRRRHRR